MSQTRRDVSPVVAVLGIVIALTVVQLLYWRGLEGVPPKDMGPAGGAGGPASNEQPPAGRSDVWVKTMAGSPEPGHRDGRANEALFDGPAAVVCSGDRFVYVADSRNHCLRRIAPDGLVTTLAGRPGEPGFADGPAVQARFSAPAGLAFAGDGSLIVADTGNHRIRRVSSSGDVSTLAGAETARDDLGRVLGGHHDGPAREAEFCFPVGLAVSGDGVIYVADAGNRCVRRIDRNGEVSTIATDGSTELRAPTQLALDGDGHLWAADSAGGKLWRGSPAGPLRPWQPPEGAAQFIAPAGLAFVQPGKPDARLVVADSEANCLWEIGDGEAAMLAGTEAGGPLSWRDGPGNQALFSTPAAIANGARGDLLVSDFGNNCIRQVLFQPGTEEVE